MVEVDESTQRALSIARELIEAGIPVFAAPPCPSGPLAPTLPVGQAHPACGRPGHGAGAVEYDLPAKWQLTVPSPVWLERWKPGWALAAVGGWAADFLDEDPRNGGDASVGELAHLGQWPTVFGVQHTKSGGRHYLISPMRERKVVGLLPGLDYQGGDMKGVGRGFVWIAPTVGHSKEDGRLSAYEWSEAPDLAWLADFGVDEAGASLDPSLDGLRARLAGHRAKRVDQVGQGRERSGSAPRAFTREQMEMFVAPVVQRVREAQIGQIEERANDLACTLSHFVPALMSAEAAYDVLLGALGETAYDPAHPASRWEADKFQAVISDIGGRAPGDWHATFVPASAGEAASRVAEQVSAAGGEGAPGDPVAALLAEMLTMDELAERKPPRYMIQNLATYDSEVWMIGGPGSKKSFTVFDMAAHVATGKPWQGMKVNPGLVVYIIAEGAGAFGKRVKAWKAKYGDIPGDRMRALPRPVQVKDLEAWEILVQACARLRAALDPSLGMMIIVDTQARSTVGMDENSAGEMSVYTQAISRLRVATGGCVLSVHHTTKAGETTRGSSALDGAQDTRLLMKSERGSLEARLVVDKQKDLEQIDDIELRFEKVTVGQDADGEPMDSLALTPSDAWRDAGMGSADLESARVKAEEAVTPFAVRAEPESWTYVRTANNAVLQRWLLQALADTAEDTGLTQSEWKGLVEEKIGQQSASSWRKAFQRITSVHFDGLVVKVHGTSRYTIDHVQKAAELLSHD